MDRDGHLYLVGRKVDIIIRDVTNVYPLEMELAIAEHPNVSEAHIFSIPDNHTESVICAFVMHKFNTKCDVNDLKLFLEGKLSAYKMPKHIRFVDDFPRITMRKVSKLKLVEIMLKEINTVSQIASFDNDN